MHDVRYALRLLRRDPGFTIAAIVILAVGIGVTTAVYCVVYGVLLRPLPVRDEASLFVAYATRSGIDDRAPISYPKFQEWRDSAAFGDLAAVSAARLDLIDGTAERVDAARVSGNFFAVLGVRAALGRVFTAADRTASEMPAVISDALWRRRFAADPAILGRQFAAGNLRPIIVGVMPPRFERWRGEAHIWLPIEGAVPEAILNSRNYHLFSAIGRIRRDGSLSQVRASLDAADREVEARSLDKDQTGVRLVRLRDDVVPSRVMRVILMLFVTVGLTWLVVCANVSTLVMARWTRRTAELTMRLVIGADRSRLIRQLVIENAVLAVPSSALAVLIAMWTTASFVAAGPPGILDLSAVKFDLPIVAFASGLTALSVCLIGLLPSLRASRVTLLTQRDESGGPHVRHLSNVLTAGQVATALLVLAGALLLVKSVVRMQQVQLGFDAQNVLTFRVSLPTAKYGSSDSIDDPRYVPAQRQLLERLRSMPGVHGVTLGDSIFQPNVDARTSIQFDDGRRLLNGNPKDRPMAPGLHFVGPDYFRVHGTQMIDGREFTGNDDFTSPRAVVINETMARMHWPGRNPIGRRVNFGRRRAGTLDEPWAEIVGIVTDIRHGGVETPPKPEIYRSAFQYPRQEFELIIRTSIPPESVAAEAREAVRAFDPDIPVFAARPLAEVVADSTAIVRYSSVLLSLFAGITSLLCAIGVFSLLAYGVAARRRELAIRVALGATARRVVLDVFHQASWVLIAGVGVGLGLAVCATRVLSSLLYDVSPLDPVAIAAAALLIACIGIAAAWIPARHAARVDPVSALRTDYS